MASQYPVPYMGPTVDAYMKMYLLRFSKLVVVLCAHMIREQQF